jgi:hypothetical protein
MRAADGALVGFAVPNSPRHGLGSPRRYPAPRGLPVIGVVRHARKLAWLGAAENRAVLQATEPLRRDGLPVLECDVPFSGEAPQLWPLVVYPGQSIAMCVAPDRSLWQIDFDKRVSERLAEDVVAVAPLRQGGALLAVERHGSAPVATRGSIVRLERVPRLVPTPLCFESFAHVLLRVLPASPSVWVIAHEVAPGTYQIERYIPDAPPDERTGGAPHILHAPPRASVVGVDAVGEQGADVGLYVLDDARRELSAIGRGRSRVLLTTSSEIDELSIATSAGRLAYTTKGGELGFVERSGKVLWRGELSKP